ncbi:hypothetical protein Ccrd_015941 [Cynara cardunculus var. scolymus]|uniref:Uncharacterized protein n=1 Tax=Cynara cardunculus var. scolymus TaxID=59895 RepID=A0A103YAW8_CYNCS|nr:hypothetical protein Ccrd_015941 [Cynara cardunculus var. scolymus]
MGFSSLIESGFDFGFKKGFIEAMESVSMAAILNTSNVCFFSWFIVWGFLDILKQRRGGGGGERTRFLRNLPLFSIITLVSSFIIMISHMGFCVCKFLKHEVVTCESVILAFTWCLATVVTVYSLVNRRVGQTRRWCMVLVLFWVFSGILDLVLVTFIIFDYFESKNMHILGSIANIIDIFTLPFLILLCSNGVQFCVTKKHKELEEPLLQENGQENLGDTSAFTKAGIWKRVTFNWLNPLFVLGRTQKLEFNHVPSIPESETAEEAAFWLEESLQKQKTRVSTVEGKEDCINQ